jgi:hypothetical protein
LQRSKLEYDNLLSTFAFNFNLRRYKLARASVVAQKALAEAVAAADTAAAPGRKEAAAAEEGSGPVSGGSTVAAIGVGALEAGAYTRSRHSST